MYDRIFRIVYGSIILSAVYWEYNPLMLGLVLVLTFEGITNWRLSLFVRKLSGKSGSNAETMGIFPSMQLFQIPFIAERAWRILVAALLYLSVFLFPDALWALPWFMGFAILGAGISGVCPMLFSLHLIGFK